MKKYYVLISLIVLLLFNTVQAQLFVQKDTIYTHVLAVNKAAIEVGPNDSLFYYVVMNAEKEDREAKLLVLSPNKVVRVNKIPAFSPYCGEVWISDAYVYNNRLYILNNGEELIVAELQQNGKYKVVARQNVLLQTGRAYNAISVADSIHVLLLSYKDNRRSITDTCDSYALCVYNVEEGKVEHSRSLYLGRGIVYNHATVYTPLVSNGRHILLAHPTKPEIYVFNTQLQLTDTIHCPFVTHVNLDSIVHSRLTDDIMATKNFSDRFFFYNI